VIRFTDSVPTVLRYDEWSSSYQFSLTNLGMRFIAVILSYRLLTSYG